MATKTVISQYVKEMRKRHGLTQVDLAQRAGVGLRFMRELEQGKATLRLDKVNQVLALFGAECGPVPLPQSEPQLELVVDDTSAPSHRPLR